MNSEGNIFHINLRLIKHYLKRTPERSHTNRNRLAYFDLIKIKKATKSMFCGFLMEFGSPFGRGSRT